MNSFRHLEAYLGIFARWWQPDATVLTDDIPIGATRKLLKRELRQECRHYNTRDFPHHADTF